MQTICRGTKCAKIPSTHIELLVCGIAATLCFGHSRDSFNKGFEVRDATFVTLTICNVSACRKLGGDDNPNCEMYIYMI